MQHILYIQSGALVLMLFCALAYRLSWLPFRLSFLLFLTLALILVITAAYVLVSMFSEPKLSKLLQLVLGALPLVAFCSIVGTGGLKVPKIHDISTRQSPPILFEAAQSLRSQSQNSLELPNNEVLALQKGFYKEIYPYVLDLPVSDCFSLLERSVSLLGWQTIASDSVSGWLEAYESSIVFGFKDDIRVELLPLGDSSCQVDARSVSREGISDLGVNAKRIKRLFLTMEQIASET